MALFNFLIDRTHIDGLFLVGRWRREKHEEVMAFSSRSFGSSFGSQVHEVDVVDNYVGIVLLPPLFAEHAIEPSIVSGNEMAPLKNFQSLLLGSRPLGKEKKRPAASSDSGSAT